ncbi:MAG TPA: hypothetical protein VFP65_05590 [Anaeromyxobacteraceae bacterium]|nr:hypothetical protein [Anaeromyxobacteraceae bacterium]
MGATLTFDVPANTASITIVEQAVRAPDALTFQGIPVENTAVPLLVTAPGGEVWYDDRLQPASNPEGALVFFASSSPATGSLTVPNTTPGLNRGVLPAGTWSVVVGDFAYECTVLSPNPCGSTGNTSSTYDVTVITKPAASGAIPTTGTLDVTFHVVGTQTADPAHPLPTTATDVAKDPDIQRMVTTLRAIYQDGGSGIVIREHFADVSADVRSQYSGLIDVDSTGACAPLPQLLKNSGDGTSIHIFLVNGFTAAGLPAGSKVAGVDGTIPGPATVGGTVASGAAVGTDGLRFGTAQSRCNGLPDYTGCGDDLTAMIVAHEMGHFLGLYHVTELAGFDFDTLSDTPQCPCATCRLSTAIDGACNRNGTGHAVTNAECSGARPGCGGGNNLMFWFTPDTLGPLTAEQQRVVRANPQLVSP